MIRDYESGESGQAQFFYGVEVEKTPAYGKKTLFVVGVHHVDDISNNLGREGCDHIFFGANHSFGPESIEDWKEWNAMISHFLDRGYLVSLDIPVTLAEEVLEESWNENDNFIPQIRVPIPYIKQWNYNTCLKIDDRGYRATNPGVWSHSLHELRTRDSFTPWSEYENDRILK